MADREQTRRDAELDTNESARLWRKRVSWTWAGDNGTRCNGYVYECPRCHWKARPMAHHGGAFRLGSIHDLGCR